MFGFNDMIGVRIDTSCKDKFTEEKKELFDIYTNICIAITDENTQMLNNSIPTKNIKSIIGSIKTKEKWIEEIQKQIIKYYGIEILKIRINIKGNTATIKATNKVRAKLYEYRGSWVVDSYLILEKDNNNWIVKEILI